MCILQDHRHLGSRGNICSFLWLLLEKFCPHSTSEWFFGKETLMERKSYLPEAFLKILSSQSNLKVGFPLFYFVIYFPWHCFHGQQHDICGRSLSHNWVHYWGGMSLLFVNEVSKLLLIIPNHICALLNSPLHVFPFIEVWVQSNTLCAHNLDTFHGNQFPNLFHYWKYIFNRKNIIILKHKLFRCIFYINKSLGNQKGKSKWFFGWEHLLKTR